MLRSLRRSRARINGAARLATSCSTLARCCWASWYLAKTGVDNSTLLRPHDGTPYAIINYVRLPNSPPRFLLNQLLRPSFTSFVRAALRSNGMAALPGFFSPISH